MKIALRDALPKIVFASMLLSGGWAAADSIKTYQVTGPVLEVSDSSITVQKDKEKWQLARDKDTKITGDLKVGAKVTVQYRMTATTVEVKGDAKAAKADSKAADAKGAAPAAGEKTPPAAKK